jgi:GAF domain-containing protein
VAPDHKLGEVGTEIAPEIARDADAAARVDALLRQVCHLARCLTGAEQAAMALHATVDDAPRKYFSLSAAYAPWRDYRPDPKGLGLHGLEIPPGEVIRLTQAEVEAHPAWRSFGSEAADHPPMRGWLATAVCGEGDYRYGLLQLSDKGGEADFTPEDEVRLRELAELVGAALDALRFSHAQAAT